MPDFLIRQYAVSVNGFPVFMFYAATASKARAEAWRQYTCAYNDCTFKNFLRISSIRREDTNLPPRFGERVTVCGLQAFVVRDDGHYINFVRPGQDTILLAHPNDVKGGA